MTAKLYFFNRKKQQTSLIYCLKRWTKYWLAVLIQSSAFKHNIDRNHSGKSNEWERRKARNMKLSCTIILSNSTKRFNGQKGQQTFKSENCVFRLVTYNQLQPAVHSWSCLHSDGAQANTIWNRVPLCSPTWALNGKKGKPFLVLKKPKSYVQIPTINNNKSTSLYIYIQFLAA